MQIEEFGGCSFGAGLFGRLPSNPSFPFLEAFSDVLVILGVDGKFSTKRTKVAIFLIP